MWLIECGLEVNGLQKYPGEMLLLRFNYSFGYSITCSKLRNSGRLLLKQDNVFCPDDS